MKRLLILLAVPFLLAAPVYAAPLSPQNAAGDGGILSELEEALTEKDNNREEVFSEVEGALSDETGKYTENTGGNVDKALAGRPQEAAGEEAEDGWTVQEVRYQFEHSMLPRYYYDVPENMLSVIADPGIYVLWESVSTENGVDPTYSEDEYETYWYQAEDGTVIAQVTLPEPDQNMLCFRVYFVYNGKRGIQRIIPLNWSISWTRTTDSPTSAPGMQKENTPFLRMRRSWIKAAASMKKSCGKKRK